MTTTTTTNARQAILGLLRPGETLRLRGRPGTGKTFHLMHLAKAAAVGGPWLLWQVSRGNVLWLSFQHAAECVQRRIGALPGTAPEAGTTVLPSNVTVASMQEPKRKAAFQTFDGALDYARQRAGQYHYLVVDAMHMGLPDGAEPTVDVDAWRKLKALAAQVDACVLATDRDERPPAGPGLDADLEVRFMRRPACLPPVVRPPWAVTAETIPDTPPVKRPPWEATETYRALTVHRPTAANARNRTFWRTDLATNAVSQFHFPAAPARRPGLSPAAPTHGLGGNRRTTPAMPALAMASSTPYSVAGLRGGLG